MEMLPRPYVEMIKLWRKLYQLDPRVNAMIVIRVRQAYPEFELWCEDSKDLAFYNYAAFKMLDLLSFVQRLGSSVQIHGEGIAFGVKIGIEFPVIKLNWFQKALKWIGLLPSRYIGKPMTAWSDFIVLDPACVEIRKSALSTIQKNSFYFRPLNTKELQDFLKRYRPETFGIPVAAHDGDLIPLNSELVSCIQHLANYADLRGTPTYKYGSALTAMNAGQPFEDLDDFESDEWTRGREYDRLDMETWMRWNFFEPLRVANGLKELPQIRWSQPVAFKGW